MASLITRLLMKEFKRGALRVSKNDLNTSQTKKPKTLRHPFTDDEYNETSYYIENGLRKVYPYYFNYKAFAKERWIGKRIFDVFASEFRVRPKPVELFRRRIEQGLVRVNSEKVGIDYRIRQSDLVSSTVHRHELPVTTESITFLHKDEEKLVVNKPASIPVHPCGRYRHNTLLFILAKEYNLKNLLPVHRLDSLTSGILIFALNPNKAKSLVQQFYHQHVEKEYICRVEGNFPNGVSICEEPIEVVDKKIGISKVSPNGKPSTTIFEKISYNGRSSLIFCRPTTGRSHQIRVHLQYLGFPVVKDPIYNRIVFEPEKNERTGGGERVITDVSNGGKCRYMGNDLEEYIGTASSTNATDINKTSSPTNIFESSNSYKHSTTYFNCGEQTSADMSFNPHKVSVDEDCPECKMCFEDPDPLDLFICLHAWKYKGPDWSFETELPIWTNEEWNH